MNAGQHTPSDSCRNFASSFRVATEAKLSGTDIAQPLDTTRRLFRSFIVPVRATESAIEDLQSPFIAVIGEPVLGGILGSPPARDLFSVEDTLVSGTKFQ